MDSNMDPKKQCLMLNVVHFLQDELINGNLNDERKESVEVAIQCLETAFELDNDTRKKIGKDKVDLLSLLPVKVEITEDRHKEAELFKNRGNTHMKNGEYKEAVEEYTKAVKLNPNNAVYFCNRAAAYSRLEKHLDAIFDCKEAIKLDSSYGKAYGRLGIAYSNLNKFDDARTAYMLALKHDPGNAMYETNLKLAEEKMFANMDFPNFSESAAPPEHRPLDISQFINNPHLLHMATEMLSNSNFRNLVSGIMSTSPTEPGQANLDALFQAGQVLANRMQSTDPNFVENLRRSLGAQSASASEENNVNQGDKADTNKKPES